MTYGLYCRDVSRRKEQIKVLFCPKCKSRDVKYVFEFKNIFGILPNMRCGNCGNESATFPLFVTNKKLLVDSTKGSIEKIKIKELENNDI